ncbi:hypothetical protein GCG54_00010416 [Colletotrichum gloeosporioides]|uniref:Uncharacterized protein n=1 Tax=Colletotrichum gloeosporioides TaxID=474922 RepID=A0A8H4CW32_COLGL|nr:uncharacterized protein GCG54_00010416 [Colletotrichum gloeosporioides]KAF3811080.1 hypothetical protein GCG54_00010416 [Colletotrichum gloeosporioides]
MASNETLVQDPDRNEHNAHSQLAENGEKTANPQPSRVASESSPSITTIVNNENLNPQRTVQNDPAGRGTPLITRSRARMSVQVTDRYIENAAAAPDWMRKTLVRHDMMTRSVVQWAMAPMDNPRKIILAPILAALRSLLTAIPLLFFNFVPNSLCWAAWDPKDIYDPYLEFNGKYNVNDPDAGRGDSGPVGDDGLSHLDVLARRTYPSKLLLKGEDGKWTPTDMNTVNKRPKYLFVSHVGSKTKQDELQYLDTAQRLAEKEGLTAIYLDDWCFTRHIKQKVKSGTLSENEGIAITDHQIWTLCDVVRGSAQVAVIYLGDSSSSKSKTEWGKRMWTFVEGLLAPGNSILFCPRDYDREAFPDGPPVESLYKVEMTASYWSESDKQATHEGGSSARLLAEYFSGQVVLSTLEVLPLIFDALNSRNTGNQNSLSDMGYAAMGLLRFRVGRTPDSTDSPTLFQTLSHLSLKNDSDKIIDRMISLLPLSRPKGPVLSDASNHIIWASLCGKDVFGARVHQITPLCDVVGVADEDHTVFIDNCRAIKIQWDSLPALRVENHPAAETGFVRFLRTAAMSSMSTVIGMSITMAAVAGVNSGSSGNSGRTSSLSGDDRPSDFAIRMLSKIVAIAACIGCACALLIPAAARSMFGTFKVQKCNPGLVGIEGVMPIKELEEKILGYKSSADIFKYAPLASHILADEDSLDSETRTLEKGRPAWIEQTEDLDGVKARLKREQRLFTLVDLGHLSVMVVAAERPPSVALLSGRGGGMLRAVLCSSSPAKDCLYKETVVQMPSAVWDSAKPTKWLKVCLQTRNEAMRARYLASEATIAADSAQEAADRSSACACRAAADAKRASHNSNGSPETKSVSGAREAADLAKSAAEDAASAAKKARKAADDAGPEKEVGLAKRGLDAARQALGDANDAWLRASYQADKARFAADRVIYK